MFAALSFFKKRASNAPFLSLEYQHISVLASSSHYLTDEKPYFLQVHAKESLKFHIFRLDYIFFIWLGKTYPFGEYPQKQIQFQFRILLFFRLALHACINWLVIYIPLMSLCKRSLRFSIFKSVYSARASPSEKYFMRYSSCSSFLKRASNVPYFSLEYLTILYHPPPLSIL